LIKITQRLSQNNTLDSRINLLLKENATFGPQRKGIKNKKICQNKNANPARERFLSASRQRE
jgi:ribosomal protein S6E (S10)